MLDRMIKIPRCMSTQHPDNAGPPPFLNKPLISGEDEVTEAYYAYSTLKCDEQLWDHEGKEVDGFVISKLLANHSDFFSKQQIGDKVFLTLRVPNPNVQKADAKLLLEILERIPRFSDIAHHFYKNDVCPVFEVIVPMTTSVLELDRIWYYYVNCVSSKSNIRVFPEDALVKHWIGEFVPKSIRVTPLIEDKQTFFNVDHILEKFLSNKPFKWYRVFFARSDSALTCGNVASIMLLKIGLYRVYRLQEKIGIPLYPIVGFGSVPFRGHLNPINVKSVLREFSSVQTLTIQSSFKFDYDESVVQNGISQILDTKPGLPYLIDDEEVLVRLINKSQKNYVRQVAYLYDLINYITEYISPRRKRKLHIGLFCYARQIGSHSLPRAISFCAALYSIGLPPELLGLSELDKDDLNVIQKVYPSFMKDMLVALKFFDLNSLDLVPLELKNDILKTIKLLDCYDPSIKDQEHAEYTRSIRFLIQEDRVDDLPSMIDKCAKVRKFLG